VDKSHKQASEPRRKISGIYDRLNCLPIFQDFDGLSTLIIRVVMSDERNEPDICESAHLALTMTQCASKSGFKLSRSKLLCIRYLSIYFILLAPLLTRFTKYFLRSRMAIGISTRWVLKKFQDRKMRCVPTTDRPIDWAISQCAIGGTRCSWRYKI
jgi:hypothetical protein